MASDLSALALISEQINETGEFTVWMFWWRDSVNNREQYEEVYLTEERACRAATEWIADYHYGRTENDPEDGWEPPRTQEGISLWFANSDTLTGSVLSIAVNISLT